MGRAEQVHRLGPAGVGDRRPDPSRTATNARVSTVVTPVPRCSSTVSHRKMTIGSDRSKGDGATTSLFCRPRRRRRPSRQSGRAS